MAYINFKKLKNRVSITDVLDHYHLLEGLQETAQGFAGECPFCESNAFKVNTEKNAWFCFGECKTKAKEKESNGGNILDLVARKEGVSVKKAAVMIAGWFPAEASRESKQERESKKDQHEAKAKKPEPSEESEKTKEETSEEPTSEIQETTHAGGEGVRSVGDTSDAHSAKPAEVTDSTQPDLKGLRNKPLDFTLKSIDVEHPTLETLGLARETLTAFGVGYFTGKGVMHDKVVLPFHNEEGLLVAYAGYSPKDGSIRYPKQFDRRLEIFNYWRSMNSGLVEDGIVLVTDLLNVLRLYELGIHRVVALPTETLHAPQLAHIHRLVGDGGRVDLVPWTHEYVDILALLLPHFHVRLHRYHEGSKDEFLREVANSLG